MTTAIIKPTRTRRWGIPIARYNKCICEMESGGTYHLQYASTSPPEISLSDAHGNHLAHIELQNGFKSWLYSECSVMDSATGAELARFSNTSYTSLGAHGNAAEPITTSFRLFRLVSTSRLFKATRGLLQFSPVTVEINDESVATPVILACYALYVANES